MVTLRLLITGSEGMVGSALVGEAARQNGYSILKVSRSEVDLTRQSEVESLLERERPDAIFIAAAKVGGIFANQEYPAEFIHQNLMIATNLIHGAHLADVERIVFLGSSCIYPKHAPQPIEEGHLLTSPLEPSNEAYAIAKIAGLKLCQFYRQQYGRTYHSLMPCNLYGPGDNYHPDHSHVIPALIRRFHEARKAEMESVTIWGTGTPLREFLHVDDLARACFHFLHLENPPDFVNIGSGGEISILELAHLIAEAVGYRGEILTDASKPDGTPRKLMSSELAASTGWEARISLKEGLATAYRDFLSGPYRSV